MNPIRSIIALALLALPFVSTSLAQTQTKGRVLYNGLGHVQAAWERSDFQRMWLEMVQWSMGLIPGDATP